MEFLRESGGPGRRGQIDEQVDEQVDGGRPAGLVARMVPAHTLGESA